MKASKIKPGMVISITNLSGNTRTVLILATTGIIDVEYTHLDINDAYGGPCVGTISGKTNVELVEGENRKHVIEIIKKEVFRNLHDINNTIDMIRLIEAMSK